MTDSLVSLLLTGLLLFSVLIVLAYVVVRIVFVRIAERLARELGPRIDRATARLPGTSAGRAFPADAERRVLERLARIERLMDRRFTLPLVGGVGLDALIGFIPYVGDATSAVVTASLILNSLKFGLPRAVVAQMVANMFVDLLFGSIPFVGDLFDVAFKANTRNIALLRAHLERRPRP